MTTEEAVPFNTVSVVEDILQQRGGHFDGKLASRRDEEASVRRNEATEWMRKTLGVVAGRDLPAEPSEEDFRVALRTGIILCNVLNKVVPGSIPKIIQAPKDSVLVTDGGAPIVFQYGENVKSFIEAVGEMGIPTFEASDMEKGGNLSRVVSCLLELKSYAEWVQGGKIGSWKLAGLPNSKPPLMKTLLRRNSEPSMMKSMGNTLGDKDSSATDNDPKSNLIQMNSTYPSLISLVREHLSNKRTEEIPFVVESLLSQVMNEFEQRLLEQHERIRTIQQEKLSSCKPDEDRLPEGQETVKTIQQEKVSSSKPDEERLPERQETQVREIQQETASPFKPDKQRLIEQQETKLKEIQEQLRAAQQELLRAAQQEQLRAVQQDKVSSSKPEPLVSKAAPIDEEMEEKEEKIDTKEETMEENVEEMMEETQAEEVEMEEEEEEIDEMEEKGEETKDLDLPRDNGPSLEFLRQQENIRKEELLRQEEIIRQERARHEEIIREGERVRQEELIRQEEIIRQAERARQEEIIRQGEKLRQEELIRHEEIIREGERVRQELIREGERVRQEELIRQEEIIRQAERARQEEIIREGERIRQEELIRQEEIIRQAERARQEEIIRQGEKLRQEERARHEEIIRQHEITLQQERARQEEMIRQQEIVRQQERSRQQAIVQRQNKSLQDLKTIVHQTKSGVQAMHKKYQEDFLVLCKHVRSLVSAAAGYQKVLEENRKLYNQVQDLKGNIRVYCRVRPFLGAPSPNQSVGSIDDGSISILTPSNYGKEGKKTFNFNKCFGPSATQSQVFADTQPLIRSVLDGYNVCIFAYGQTGSGKTFTMSGPDDLTEETMGVNYRALNDLFLLQDQRKDTIIYEIGVQMLEIYNEQVRDLLSTDGATKKLEIRNRSQNGLNVPDANLVPVATTADVINLMNLGNKNRAVGSTAMNSRSSRSHSCLTVHVQGKYLTSPKTIHASLHLVDLAGSERADKTEATGDRLKEAQYINKSLSALGDVISSLAAKSSHVPYRNSKLTQLLQDSLGGQAKTLMFVHISPEPDAVGETLSTLKFAERVATVELGAAKANNAGGDNKAGNNANTSGGSSKDGADVKDLKDQIASLKAALARKDAELEQYQGMNLDGAKLNKSHGSTPSLRNLGSTGGARKLPRDDSANSEGQNQDESKLKRRSLDYEDMETRYENSGDWMNNHNNKMAMAMAMKRNDSLTSNDSLVAQWEADNKPSSPSSSPTSYDYDDDMATNDNSSEASDMNWQPTPKSTSSTPSNASSSLKPKKTTTTAPLKPTKTADRSPASSAPTPAAKKPAAAVGSQVKKVAATDVKKRVGGAK
ncbi:kinesin-like protein KIN-14I isoform X4 [Arachis hypogaea]|uniref:kinesin-like protein KIN-14I isoform X4 n=1 Tax=Arachis hypogaea TaxID=3818 RepID=UPI003B21DAB8